MYKGLLVFVIISGFVPVLRAAPSNQVITDGSKRLAKPFVTMYTRVKNYIQSDATSKKAHKAWEVAQTVAVATVVANLILPDKVKKALCRVPIASRFIFYGPFVWPLPVS